MKLHVELLHAEVQSERELREFHLNALKPKQNGRLFPDDIFKCIFFNENVWISIKIPPKFVPKGSINNIPALVQIMAWRLVGRQAIIWANDGLVYWRIFISRGRNELMHYLVGKVCPWPYTMTCRNTDITAILSTILVLMTCNTWVGPRLIPCEITACFVKQNNKQ